MSNNNNSDEDPHADSRADPTTYTRITKYDKDPRFTHHPWMRTYYPNDTKGGRRRSQKRPTARRLRRRSSKRQSRKMNQRRKY